MEWAFEVPGLACLGASAGTDQRVGVRAVPFETLARLPILRWAHFAALKAERGTGCSRPGSRYFVLVPGCESPLRLGEGLHVSVRMLGTMDLHFYFAGLMTPASVTPHYATIVDGLGLGKMEGSILSLVFDPQLSPEDTTHLLLCMCPTNRSTSGPKRQLQPQQDADYSKA